MFQDFVDELQFFPVLFNFDICDFKIYGILVAGISCIYRGLLIVCFFHFTEVCVGRKPFT
jgi:hypothetical protein